MEFQQLEVFVAVVEEGSILRAAERVYRTSPAVCIALRKLETEIGLPLIDRSVRNKFFATPFGEVIYAYARNALNGRREVLKALKELSVYRNRLSGQISLPVFTKG